MTTNNEQPKELVPPDHIVVNGQRVELVFERPYRETLQTFIDSIARARPQAQTATEKVGNKK